MNHNELIAALRRRLAETRDAHREPPMAGLEDLAAANPRLHERLERVREANPGLRQPSRPETEAMEEK